MNDVSSRPRPPLFVVLNAGSGHGDADESVATIRRVFESAGRRHELLLAGNGREVADYAARAVERASRERGAVVAAGGDGTLNTVAQAVLPTGLPFGALPQGTFNYFGRAQGLPLDTADAASALLDADVRPVQVGLLNERIFLVNASVGLYPRLLEDREEFKRDHGRNRFTAAIAACLTLLRTSGGQLDVRLARDDAREILRTTTIVVANNRMQLENLGIADAAAVDAGDLVAISVKPVGTLALFGLALRGALGRLGDADNVRSFAFRAMTVAPLSARSGASMKVAIDGEVTRMTTPLHFRVAPRPLQLLVAR